MHEWAKSFSLTKPDWVVYTKTVKIKARKNLVSIRTVDGLA